MKFDSPEIVCAVAAVRESALLARAVQQELVTPALVKDDRSPVTVGDFAVQAVIARRLAEGLPGVTLVGEESAAALQLEEGVETLDQVTQFVRRSVADATPEEVCGLIDRGSGEPPAEFWTLDPIDGTKGFLRRDQYAVALGKIENGTVTIGVLGCPELVNASVPAAGGAGSLLVAVLGEGTWCQPLSGGGEWKQLHVSDRRDVAQARVLRSVEKAHTNVDEIGRLAEQLGITAPPVPLDSQAKYAVLAAGAGDVLLRLISPKAPNYKEKIWDQAAGSLVISEAGGRITDLDGKPLDFSHGRELKTNRGILATNGPLHDALLAGLRAIGA
ncbi:MAG: 3'(2'),5'-bisphosphate nucleotidase [Pirellulales bacterium]